MQVDEARADKLSARVDYPLGEAALWQYPVVKANRVVGYPPAVNHTRVDDFCYHMLYLYYRCHSSTESKEYRQRIVDVSLLGQLNLEH